MLVIDRSVRNKSSTKPSKLITSTYGQTHVISVLIAYPQMSLIETHKFTYLSKLNPKTSIATKVVCFSRMLKCLRSLCGKQCGLRSDCSYRSSLFWVHAVCFYTKIVSNVRQLFAADDFSRRHFQMHFFLGALRVEGLNVGLVTHHNVNKTTCTNTLPGYTRVYMGLLTVYFIIYWLNG